MIEIERVLLELAGGVSLLRYGLHLAGEGLQALAGARLRYALASLTKNRVLGLGAGALITAILQSSSATTVMLVGFTGSGLLTLRQAVAVILGADVGTTATVQLLAFPVTDYALGVIAVGFLLFFFGHRQRTKTLGTALLGFGLIFLGLRLIASGAEPLLDAPMVGHAFLALGDHPVLGIAISAAVTALLHSSAATIGIALALSAQGLLTLHGALPIILGANVGTCAPALISSLGGVPEAKRVALAHALFKVAGVVLVYPILPWFERWVGLSAANLPHQIANAHTLFNLGLAVVFLPFTVPFAGVVARLVKERPRADEWARPKYLDPHVLDVPSLALSQATRETLRMADLVHEMVSDTIKAFADGDQELVESIERKEDWVDALNREIKLYITKLSEKSLTKEQLDREMVLLAVINDLENIGDIVDKNLMELAKKKLYKDLRFSDSGVREMIELHALVEKNFERVIAAFASQDAEVAKQVIEEKARISYKERQLKQAHIHRLHAGLPESIETSAIHLDVLTNLKRINSHVTNIAYPLVDQPQEG
ncbi:MAG: Na/Pi cotransporter family protein [Nitrospirota bacterium]